tara:strand:- start:10331 stop:10663 length:333 start_codon:yes stop_codon:yes gene_type:complete
MKKIIFMVSFFYSTFALSATVISDYMPIGKLNVQGASGDVYLYLDDIDTGIVEAWKYGGACTTAYIAGSVDPNGKLYSTILAAKLASKDVAFLGECNSPYFKVTGGIYMK